MGQYIIQPWGTAEQDLEDVPAELTQLAKKVTTQYDLKLLGMHMITSKPDKGGAIWRIDTNKGQRSLKVLHRTPERSLFSVGAQEYLVNKGARVPKLIPSKSGNNYVEAGGKLWIVTDWIDLTPASQLDIKGFGMICYGLGEFHQHSKGYIPPFGAKFSSRLHAYPRQYQKMATKINWFRELARAYPEMPASRMLYLMVDKYERQAIRALESLNNSPYYQLVTKGEPHWGLAHQDYGFSNGQLGPKGVWIIDLDGVSYDLPIRDLRKLVTSSMEDKGVWDVNWMNEMIQAYHQANPIDPDLFQVFLIDMMLPNEFYKHVKEIIYSPTTLMNHELEALLTNIENLDATKWKALQQLSKEWKVGGKNIPNWEKITKENAPAKRRKELIPAPQKKPKRRLIPRKGVSPLRKPKRKLGVTPIQQPKRRVGVTPVQRPKRRVGVTPVQRPKRKVGVTPVQRPKRRVGVTPVQTPKHKIGFTPTRKKRRATTKSLRQKRSLRTPIPKMIKRRVQTL
jgi:CotS family spore coat protein